MTIHHRDIAAKESEGVASVVAVAVGDSVAAVDALGKKYFSLKK